MFFARSRRTEVLPAGVHVSADGLRLIQLRVTPDVGGNSQCRLSVAASHAASFDFTDTQDVGPAIAAKSVRGRLRDAGVVGRDVVTALPPAMIHLRTFRMPPLPKAEMEAATRAQAREGAPFGDREPIHIEAVAVGEAHQGRDVRDEYVCVAARDRDVCGFLEAFGPSVVVRSLQAEPFAIYRIVAGAAVCPERETTHAIVHVGESETLVLIGTGPLLRVVRRVDVGADHLDSVVARKLGVTTAEAGRLRHPTAGRDGDPVGEAIDAATRPHLEEIARETAMCIRYQAVSFRRALPARVKLLGRYATDPQLQSLLGAATGLAVDAGSVLDGFAGRPCVDDGGWAVALGLALTFAPPLPSTDKAPRPTASVEMAGEVDRA